MEHSQGTWHGVSTQYTKTEKRGNLIHPVGQGKVWGGGDGEVGGGVTYVLAGVLTDDPTVVFVCPVAAV